jgi:hypothetical protein
VLAGMMAIVPAWKALNELVLFLGHLVQRDICRSGSYIFCSVYSAWLLMVAVFWSVPTHAAELI